MSQKLVFQCAAVINHTRIAAQCQNARMEEQFTSRKTDGMYLMRTMQNKNFNCEGEWAKMATQAEEAKLAVGVWKLPAWIWAKLALLIWAKLALWIWKSVTQVLETGLADYDS